MFFGGRVVSSRLYNGFAAVGIDGDGMCYYFK